MKYTRPYIGQRITFRRDLDTRMYGADGDDTFSKCISKKRALKLRGRSFEISDIDTYYTNIFRIKGDNHNWYVMEMTDNTSLYQIY